ncbi:hypothetical protein VaNZ11_015744 [Volvox africanus]|uniref:chloroplast protein-transporting ATPase n=1 Tax=Volvox africanus TaxID=51714 RepID=A0ABQ5SLD1_9CHLO|nr:hypothetical protein VaNZ11_015744 [Volvox africanus]
MKDTCLRSGLPGLRRAPSSIAPPGSSRSHETWNSPKPSTGAQQPRVADVSVRAGGMDARPMVLAPPPSQRPPPLRLLQQQLPQHNPHHLLQSLPHSIPAGAQAVPYSFTCRGGSVVFLGPLHHPLARPTTRRVAVGALSEAAAATGVSSGELQQQQQQQPPKPEYNLPAHWQEQMARAPLGRKRVLQRYYADVIAINNLEPEMRALSNAQLRAKTGEFKRRLAGGQSLQSLRVEAFAVVREASRRVLGMRHYDCQLVGGMVLAEGRVAEMQTGEGKTLVATLPGYLGALTGRGVHVVTVNDYLAARDAAWMGKLYRFLGLTCAAVQSTSSVVAARAAFSADVTYVTGQELGFSFLRDNTALSPQDLTLRDDRFHFAIVDEVDSILIDESRNPMIISGKGSSDTRVVQLVDKAVRRLWSQVQSDIAAEVAAHGPPGSLSDADLQRLEKGLKSRYYTVDEKSRTLSYTSTGTHLIFLYLLDEGAQFADSYPGVHSLWEEDVPWGRLAVTALTAYELYINGKDYIVRDGEAVIVDPSTGRIRPQTRWQGGIHQAVEAKEGLRVQAENLVTATITFQLFFRQYEWLSGMTGTAQPAAAELFELYGIKVVPVPTNRPSRRVDHPPRLFYDKAVKMHCLAAEVMQAAEAQRPVLIGTTSVQESELVLNYLMQTVYPAITAATTRRAAAAARSASTAGSFASALSAAVAAAGPKPRITLLNAKPELVRLEAQVIAQAGLPGAVTIATNMAGRGTDIILGGNPEGLTKLALMRLVYRRLLKQEERETLPMLPLSQLDPYDTDDVGALSRISYSTPEAPHAGLPRPLHEVLSTAILISFAAKHQTEEGEPALFASGGGGSGGASLSFGGSMTGSYGGSLDELGGSGGAAVAATGISYGETAELVGWVMDRAEVLRRKVRGALRRTYRDHAGGLERLNYTLCVAPVIESVLAERERELYDKQLAALSAAAAAAGVVRGAPAGPGSSFTDDDEATAAAAAVATAAAASGGEDDGEEPMAQVWALRAALHLWLWFDQECARYRDEVRTAGGLLVIGTSLNESPRIELQLRGRAGRQGDPGETKMLLDCVDPLMVMFGMDKVSAMLTQLGSQLQTGPDYLEGGPVDYFVNYVVRWQESMFQNMRLETKKYDAVMEEYRHNLYTLRRLVLCGGDMQRTLIVYVLIQRYVDELVGRYLDPGQAPARWLRESVRLDSLPGAPETQPDQLPVMVSPLQAVLICLRTLVNPLGRTTKTLVDFSEVTEAAAANPTVRKMLELFGVANPRADPRDAAADGVDTQYIPVYMQVQELEVLAPEQLRNLAEYIAGTGPLEWPVPAAVEIRGNFKLQLQLRTHRKLFGYGAVRSAGIMPSEVSAAAAAAQAAERLQLSAAGGLIQRPRLRGPFAEKVAVLRNYLGELLIGCYEARRLAARLTFTASPSLGFTDIDAEQQVCAFEQQTMLLWIDALWSCFLEDTARLRNAVNIRSTNGSNPVEEFRMEANAAFLALLDNYRDAVLDKLLVPDFSIYAPLESEIADTDLVGRGGLVTQVPTEEQPAAAAADVSGRSNGDGNGNGSGNGNDMFENVHDNHLSFVVSGEAVDKPNHNGHGNGAGAAAAAAVTADYQRGGSTSTNCGVPVGSAVEGSG